MDSKGDIKGIRRIVGGDRKGGFEERGLLVEDGVGEWDFRSEICEGQRSYTSILQKLKSI